MDLVLREAMTALGCLIARPCVVLSLPLEIHPHTPVCHCPFPTFSSWKPPCTVTQASFLCVVCFVLISHCVQMCSQNAGWGAKDDGEAIERRDKDHGIFVFKKKKNHNCCLLCYSTGFTSIGEPSPCHTFCGNNRAVASHTRLVNLAHLTKTKFVLQCE